MSHAQLIDAADLQARLGEPGLVVLDCRFALEDPAQGARDYAEGHLPGAQYADLERDLSAPVIAGRTGRHPLPDAEALVERLRAWGIDDDSRVVLYDDGPGAFAARGWWLLAWLGKRQGVYLLDGGLKAWRAAGLPLTRELSTPARGQFAGTPDPALLLAADDLRLDDPRQTLLDARALPRFRGDVEPIDPVAGHIPGARCAPFSENLDANGRFLDAERLRTRFAALLEDRPFAGVVAYCGSGVTACHNLFAMSLAGYPLAALYAGSWSEWIVDPQRPVASGD